MARPDGRVTPGQRINSAFSARAWNRAQDAADIVLGSQRGFEAGPLAQTAAPYFSLPVKNLSLETVKRFHVLEITDLITDPSPIGDGDTGQFSAMPVLRGEKPLRISNAFCIALEPMAANQIGRCAVAGVVQVKCDIKSANDSYVRLQANSFRLVTGGYGEGLILWKQSGVGDNKWALVRLAIPSGAVMIKFSGAWALDQTKTCTILDTTDTVPVVNKFASILAACGERHGAAIKYGNSWYLTAAQFE